MTGIRCPSEQPRERRQPAGLGACRRLADHWAVVESNVVVEPRLWCGRGWAARRGRGAATGLGKIGPGLNSTDDLACATSAGRKVSEVAALTPTGSPRRPRVPTPDQSANPTFHTILSLILLPNEPEISIVSLMSTGTDHRWFDLFQRPGTHHWT